jgi:glutamine synthetase
MTVAPQPLTAIVTTDLAGITRGRFVLADRIDQHIQAGIGWLPANLALTAFGTIADPNPWGSAGDLRVLPDPQARFRTSATGAETPFDMIVGDITELDGTPWPCCPRTILKEAVAALKAATGLSLRVAFEQEFQVFGANFPAAHPLSMAALRRADPFAPRLAAALDEAGVEPEVVIAEFGLDQFELTCAPSDPLRAADRAIAIREIVRETARVAGWSASFAPKTAPLAVGNGVHIHFSLLDTASNPATYDPAAPAGLSATAAAFCAGVLRHLPALSLLSAPSVPSYYRLRPHSWSASWTWLADRDREASLRICPVTTMQGRDPAPQYNIEYRAADATANPYLALAGIIRAGLAGLTEALPPPAIIAEHPDDLDEARRVELGLYRLPDSLEAAIAAWNADHIVAHWFAPALVETMLCVRRAEMALLANLTDADICLLYRDLY